jgi:hypothetical protein
VNEHASAWKHLVDEWVVREQELRPEAPIAPDTVEVRDAVEVDDQLFVLVSFDVAYPWPSEEDTSAQGRTHNTAVLQAARVRQPWIERDTSRASAQLVSEDGNVTISEHVLGARRAWSGYVSDSWSRVTLHFSDGSSVDAAVVDHWFLWIGQDAHVLTAVSAGSGSEQLQLARTDVVDMVPGIGFTRSGGDAMYFSPLDLRSVHPLVRWQRNGNLVVVASCLEQYDDGGILRLRIDGVRPDDDLFVSWPQVSIRVDGQPVASASCAEFAHKDTVTLDVGFRPWIAPDSGAMTIDVAGLRGVDGTMDPVTLELSAHDFRS